MSTPIVFLDSTFHLCSCGICLLKCTCVHVPVKYCVISLKQCIPVECFDKFNKVVKFEQFVWSPETCFMCAFFLEFQQVECLDEHTPSILSLKHSRSVIENILVIYTFIFKSHIFNWLLESKFEQGLNLKLDNLFV